MFQSAERLGRVKASPTVVLNGKVAELAAQGRDVLSLVAGEPDWHDSLILRGVNSLPVRLR